MNPRSPPHPPFGEVVVETQTGSLVIKPRLPPNEPSEYIPAYVPPDLSEGGSNAGFQPSLLPDASAGVFPAPFPQECQRWRRRWRRRRRDHDDAIERSSPLDTDIISPLQMFIREAESAYTPARYPPEVGELIQRLKPGIVQLRQRQKKRSRRPAGPRPPDAPAASGERSSVSVLQETIAAIEQMRLSEPMERSEEYADVLSKLEELLRTEDDYG